MLNDHHATEDKPTRFQPIRWALERNSSTWGTSISRARPVDYAPTGKIPPWPTDFWSPPLIRCIANPPRTIVGGPADRRGAQSMAGRFVLSLMSDTWNKSTETKDRNEEQHWHALRMVVRGQIGGEVVIRCVCIRQQAPDKPL